MQPESLALLCVDSNEMKLLECALRNVSTMIIGGSVGSVSVVFAATGFDWVMISTGSFV